jgi:hypothetical protein
VSAPPIPISANPSSLAILATIAHSLEVVRACDQWVTTKGTPLFTPDGAEFVRDLVDAARTRARPYLTPLPDTTLPHWDGQLRRLSLGDRLLKWFRRPAPDQIVVLDAFQAAGWAVRRIDCPFPWSTDKQRRSAMRRLRNTVRNLNRGLPDDGIRFYGDGSGFRVLWDRPPATTTTAGPAQLLLVDVNGSVRPKAAS